MFRSKRMTADQKIEACLYPFGYKGIENIFEYWRANKDDIIVYLEQTIPDTMHDPGSLALFETRIRWASRQGLLLLLQISIEALRARKNALFDLAEITTKYDGKDLSMKEFVAKNQTSSVAADRFDMKGSPILSVRLKHMFIQNIDFTDAKFAYSQLTNVQFVNCTFKNTSFTHCVLDACTFDGNCMLVSNDFSSSYITSVFECPIIEPKTNKPRPLDIWQIKRLDDLRFIGFSHITSDSFIQNCSDEKTSAHLKRLKKRLCKEELTGDTST